MKIDKSNASDEYLSNCFSWFARIGLAPKFGTTNICHYQCEQMRVLNWFEKELNKAEIRIRKEEIQIKYSGKWILFKRLDEIPC